MGVNTKNKQLPVKTSQLSLYLKSLPRNSANEFRPSKLLALEPCIEDLLHTLKLMVILPYLGLIRPAHCAK